MLYVAGLLFTCSLWAALGEKQGLGVPLKLNTPSHVHRMGIASRWVHCEPKVGCELQILAAPLFLQEMKSKLDSHTLSAQGLLTSC